MLAMYQKNLLQSFCWHPDNSHLTLYPWASLLPASHFLMTLLFWLVTCSLDSPSLPLPISASSHGQVHSGHVQPITLSLCSGFFQVPLTVPSLILTMKPSLELSCCQCMQIDSRNRSHEREMLVLRKHQLLFIPWYHPHLGSVFLLQLTYAR